MQKRANNIFIVLAMICCLSVPTGVFALDNEILAENVVTKNSEIEVVQEGAETIETNAGPLNTSSVRDTVVPDTSREGKKVIGLFFKTMVAVFFCAILLYFILGLVKKYFPAMFSNTESEELNNLDLSTPSTKNDALKSFLNRAN